MRSAVSKKIARVEFFGDGMASKEVVDALQVLGLKTGVCSESVAARRQLGQITASLDAMMRMIPNRNDDAVRDDAAVALSFLDVLKAQLKELRGKVKAMSDCDARDEEKKSIPISLHFSISAD